MPTLMVVDDDIALLKTDIRVMQRAGLDVEAFDSPLEALLRMDDRSRPFDLVVTDYEMPDLDGISFAKLAREKLGRSCPPLLLRSGVRPLPSEVDALFVAQLEKPVGARELLTHLRAALSPGTVQTRVQLRSIAAPRHHAAYERRNAR